MRRFGHVWACFLLTTAALAGPRPVYLVRHVAEPPVLGANDGAWSQAPWSEPFGWVDTGASPPVATAFQALYSPAGLHFRVRFEGAAPPGAPLDPDFTRACEVFLDPGGRGRTYLEFAVSPENTQHAVTWHGRLSMREWRGEVGLPARSAVTYDPAGTIMYEVSFGWKDLATLDPARACPPRRGDAWRANFSRVESGEHAGDFTWAPCQFYYLHQPNTFGWLVFCGEGNDLREPPRLRALPDDAEHIADSRHFRLLSRVFWARFPLLPAGDGDWWAVTKCSVHRLANDGTPRFTRTNSDGLPQFIRAVTLVGGVLHVTGTGLAEGMARVDAQGRVQRVGVADGLELSGLMRLYRLDDETCLVTAGRRAQRLERGRFGAPITLPGDVLSACALPEGRVAVGTAQGVEVLDRSGTLVTDTMVAGGLSALVADQGAALGVSPKDGLYRLATDGTCSYFPYPLRTRFDGVWVEAPGRVWAGYTGGLLRVEREKMTRFHAPLGLAGFRVSGAAPLAGGGMIFLCTLPGDPWYQSSATAPFVLTHDGKRWRRYTYGEGLPGEPSVVTTVAGQTFVSCTAGVFRFMP